MCDRLRRKILKVSYGTHRRSNLETRELILNAIRALPACEYVWTRLVCSVFAQKQQLRKIL